MFRVLALGAFCSVMGACATAEGDSAAGAEVYEERDMSIGSNIPSRQRRAANTPQEQERIRAEVEAIRASQPRVVPRSSSSP
jgi:hypothetical protein